VSKRALTFQQRTRKPAIERVEIGLAVANHRSRMVKWFL